MPTGRDRLSKLRFDAQEMVVDIRTLARSKTTGSAKSELDPVEDALEAITMELDQALAWFTLIILATLTTAIVFWEFRGAVVLFSLSLLPFQMRARARNIWQNIETGFGAYLRSQVIQTVLALILLSLGYQVLGLKYSVDLALIAVIPAAWVGFSISPVLGLAAIALTIGVLAFLELVIEPRLFKRERYSSLLVVIVLLVLADEYGFIGILVAPPLAAAVQIFTGQILRATTRSIIAPTARPIDLVQSIGVLQTRLASVEARVAAQPEPAPELANLVTRLTQLMAQSAQQLTEPTPVVQTLTRESAIR